MQLPVVMSSECNDDPDRRNTCYWSIGVDIVHTITLKEALSDKSGLELNNLSISSTLDPEYPLTTNGFETSGKFTESECTCVDEGGDLTVSGNPPLCSVLANLGLAVGWSVISDTGGDLCLPMNDVSKHRDSGGRDVLRSRFISVTEVAL